MDAHAGLIIARSGVIGPEANYSFNDCAIQPAMDNAAELMMPFIEARVGPYQGIRIFGLDQIRQARELLVCSIYQGFGVV